MSVKKVFSAGFTFVPWLLVMQSLIKCKLYCVQRVLFGLWPSTYKSGYDDVKKQKLYCIHRGTETVEREAKQQLLLYLPYMGMRNVILKLKINFNLLT